MEIGPTTLKLQNRREPIVRDPDPLTWFSKNNYLMKNYCILSIFYCIFISNSIACVNILFVNEAQKRLKRTPKGPTKAVAALEAP